jgi:uncharacterized membrane protein
MELERVGIWLRYSAAVGGRGRAPFALAGRTFYAGLSGVGHGAARRLAVGARRADRMFWFIGGGLLAATVVKLFLFDLSHVTGIERIVSFIGIGLMLLLIGYFSSLPPKAAVLETGQ